MAARTTVNISITPELSAFVRKRVASGRYQTASEVFREALRLLEHQERDREQAFKSLKSRLRRGAAQAERGELLDGEEVFEDLRQMIRRQKPARRKPAG